MLEKVCPCWILKHSAFLAAGFGTVLHRGQVCRRALLCFHVRDSSSPFCLHSNKCLTSTSYCQQAVSVLAAGPCNRDMCDARLAATRAARAPATQHGGAASSSIATVKHCSSRQRAVCKSPVLASTITALLPPTRSEASLAETDPRLASITKRPVPRPSSSSHNWEPSSSSQPPRWFLFPSESLEKTTTRLARRGALAPKRQRFCRRGGFFFLLISFFPSFFPLNLGNNAGSSDV